MSESRRSNWISPEDGKEAFNKYAEDVRRALAASGGTQTGLSQKVGLSQPLLSKFFCGHLSTSPRMSKSLWGKFVDCGKEVGVEAPEMPDWGGLSLQRHLNPSAAPKHRAVPKAPEAPAAPAASADSRVLMVLEMVKAGDVSPTAAAKILSGL